MKTKSVNHLSITCRLTDNATSAKKDVYAAFPIVHNVGETPLFLNAKFFANKGKKYEREIPWNKLTKGNLLLLDGSLRPNTWTDAEGKSHSRIEFIVSKISEPEVIEENAPATDEETEANETASEE